MRNRKLQLEIFVALCLICIRCSGEASEDLPAQNQTTVTDPVPQELSSKISDELESYNNMNPSYDHRHTFSFKIAHVEDFLIGVDFDQQIKFNVMLYFQEGDTFFESKEEQGEETRLMVYEDRLILLVQEYFYRAKGVTFNAKKGKEYVVRMIKSGRDKLAVVNMQNYLTEGQTKWNLAKEHFGTHEEKTNKIKEQLKGILSLVERNAVINEHIASHVQKSTERYMFYQIIETLLVVLASVGQVRIIKKLLGGNSVI